MNQFSLIATHNSNALISKFITNGNAGACPADYQFIDGLNTKGQVAREELITVLKSHLAQIITSGDTPPKLINIVTDFNLGYTGNNVTPLDDLITDLNSLAVNGKKLEVVRTKAEATAAIAKGFIPVHLTLVGSGGGEYTGNLEGKLKKITAKEAMNEYAYEKLVNATVYMKEHRKLIGYSSTPSPLPSASPSSSSSSSVLPKPAALARRMTLVSASELKTSVSSNATEQARGRALSFDSRFNQGQVSQGVHVEVNRNDSVVIDELEEYCGKGVLDIGKLSESSDDLDTDVQISARAPSRAGLAERRGFAELSIEGSFFTEKEKQRVIAALLKHQEELDEAVTSTTNNITASSSSFN